MGEDLSMIVHICGIDFNNPVESSSQIDIINSIFMVSNTKDNTDDYTIRSSKKPKWNAIIYRNQKNFLKVKNTIKSFIKFRR